MNFRPALHKNVRVRWLTSYWIRKKLSFRNNINFWNLSSESNIYISRYVKQTKNLLIWSCIWNEYWFDSNFIYKINFEWFFFSKIFFRVPQNTLKIPPETFLHSHHNFFPCLSRCAAIISSIKYDYSRSWWTYFQFPLQKA